ncbi:MAG: hypothetical protein JWN08_2890 [Frankiales bacterium]|nr:hypothetical protein [Frankiales bacterium]
MAPRSTASAAVELRLAPDARHIGQARRFAVRATAELGADDHAQDAVRSLVSELVTNVLLHAGSDALVRVHDDGALVRVEVVDASPAAPRQRRVDGGSTTGRGLRLLRALSSVSGVEPDGAVGPGGKCVWFAVLKTSTDEVRDAVSSAAAQLFDGELEGSW